MIDTDSRTVKSAPISLSLEERRTLTQSKLLQLWLKNIITWPFDEHISAPPEQRLPNGGTLYGSTWAGL